MTQSRTSHRAFISAVAGALLAVAPAAIAQTSHSSTATGRIAATVIDPCTKRYVSVSGSTTLTVNDIVDGNGQLTRSVSGTTKAIGAAFSPAGTRYPMSQTDSVTLVATAPEPTEVAFTTKLAANGPVREDSWQLKVLVKATVDQFGTITAVSATPSGTVCIG